MPHNGSEMQKTCAECKKPARNKKNGSGMQKTAAECLPTWYDAFRSGMTHSAVVFLISLLPIDFRFLIFTNPNDFVAFVLNPEKGKTTAAFGLALRAILIFFVDKTNLTSLY